MIVDRRIVLCFVALALAVAPAAAQGLRGSVTDEQGRPVSAATVYVREAQLGTSASEQGTFELKLKKGSYTCIVQRIGYQTATVKVEVGAKGGELNVALAAKAYELPGVVVSGSREDYAYSVMRHAIAMAPYYSNEISSYTAEVYIKGTGKVERLSRVVKALAGKQLKQAQIREGETYLLESVNEISFTAPNTYKHKVISSTSTLPADFSSYNTLTYVNVNLYSLNLLARDAMSSYRFAYEGFVEDGAITVNKIKVTPRKKHPGLFSGYLYIIENTWRIYRADLSGKFPFGSFSVAISTNEVRDDVRLPSAYAFDAKVKGMGNEALLNYSGTVRYSGIAKNATLSNPLHSVAKKPAPADTTDAVGTAKALKRRAAKQKADSIRQQKKRDELEKLLQKDELSNREMLKVSKSLRKEAQKSRPQSLNLSDRYKIVVDSSARHHDTAYWSTIRPIPLKREEVVSYRKADSLRSVIKLPAGVAKKGSGWPMKVAAGGRYDPSPSLRITHSGLVSTAMLGFNAVDGFKYGQQVKLQKTFADSTLIHLNAKARWAFSRQALMWHVGGSYLYRPERRADLFFELGQSSTDYSSHNPESFINSALSLLIHRNYNRLYDQRYASVGHNIDVANGLTLQATLSYHNRYRLENHTNFSIFRTKARYAPNLPDNPYVDSELALHHAATASLTVSYTPRYFYRMRGRQKRMAYSDYPTVQLT
ncbi:MAG: DUF5686 and carboxypeptidase regulatory-like domain-containing protein, partial [Prevotellaceae bacterium]|nr:DUF5686 and carboxypeptidase regulatory-like domain-containing protein [Prevotellaceae bacterium]